MKSGLFCCLGVALPAAALCLAPAAFGQTGQQSMAAEGPDPTSPLDDMPDIGVDWPSLLPEQAGEPDAERVAQTEMQEWRYTVLLDGAPKDTAHQVKTRFQELSVLRKSEGQPANLAQINRRTRDDIALLRDLLRADGYYAAEIDSRLEAVGERLAVTLLVTPGPLYRFDHIRVSGLDADDGLRRAFKLAPTDPVDADAVTQAQAALKVALGNQGYPFAVVPQPDISIDHDLQSATLDLAVTTGGTRRFGAIIPQGDDVPFGAQHMAGLARFKSGQLYRQADVDDLRRAVIATGLVSSAQVEPREGSVAGTADIIVTTTPAPVRTIAGELGYGTGEGVRASASWTHRNLIRPEGAVTFAGVIGTREQSLSGALRMNNWRRRDQLLNAGVTASNARRTAYDARTLQIGANIERQTNLLWQKQWTWNAGFELLASDERDSVAQGFGRRTYFITALPALLAYDGSDDLLDPRRGFRLTARLSPEVSLQGAAFGYARLQVDASAYLPVSQGVTLASRVRLASISGARNFNIAPSRRFYAGGGGSVRGYSYQAIGPRDPFGDPTGGRSLTEFSLEARIRRGAFGFVPFLDGGNIYTGSLPSFQGLRLGAGLGVRYYSSFGPIRVDVATPINRRAGETPIGVYVSLGQAF
jgi:translocation and assembly module TamA